MTHVKIIFGVLTALVIGNTQISWAVAPTESEMAEAQRWAAATFEGRAEVETPPVGLQVLANHDAVRQNARGGRPLQIVDRQYARGLYCHAASKVVVRLPGPGRWFTATVGVDSNDQTRAGKGSIVFSVTVDGQKAFQSEVMREGMPGRQVKVDLKGAKEFTLEVGDAGDDISCDQADWADAKVVLANGKTVWLGDMPLVGANRVYGFEPGFSFTYGGRPSSELLSKWKSERSAKKLDDQRTEHTLSYTDPETGLVVRCVGIEYNDFPTVEWTLYFKNTGDKDTPILADIQALNIELERPAGSGSEFQLYHQSGSFCSAEDYRPHQTTLGPEAEKKLGGVGGRSTDRDFSYFNIQAATNEGVIVVVGWPGQWAATLKRDKENRLRIIAGQELTHFKLLPGEEVRTPLVVLQFWKGDRLHAQNVWRRWMMAYGMPKPGGKLPPPQLCASSSRAYTEMLGANEENQIMHIDRYQEEGIKLDYWWMDAGWYIQEQGWPQVGTWEVDPKRFPRGLRPISDHAHSKGVKIIVWFEPERVAAGTWLAENHPEWIFGGKNGGILNLGNPEAWNWLVDHIDKMITEQGIDLYRQDFNIEPLSYWRGADAPDRQGITEIKHVTGVLAYWDELRRRHPDLLIDNCASGGRRLDLESLRRSVPLWRSDYPYEPNSQQCQTYGLSFWLPYHGTGTVACTTNREMGYYGGGKTPVEPYAFWSNSAPSLGLGIDIREKDLDYPALRRLLQQRRQTESYYYGDYYPLMPYTLDGDAWLAWQFDVPESGEGMVQAFRRAESPYESIRVKLGGLDPEAVYTLTDLNAPEKTFDAPGKQLVEEGLSIAIKDQPGAKVIVYKKKSH